MVTKPSRYSLSLELFEDWVVEIADEIGEVDGLLAERLSDNPATLTIQLSQIEAWHGRMTKLMADANAYLDMARQKQLPARGEKWTDLDREIQMRGNTANEKRIRDTLEGLCESIRSRIILGMSTRKQSAGESSHFQS